MSRDMHQVIRRPLITERNMHRAETRNQYTFEVAEDANRVQIRQAIEKLFNVRVRNVNTINVKGKRKRLGFNTFESGRMKKAVVTLHEDDRIDLI